MSAMSDYTSEQLETLIVAFLDDLELIGLNVVLLGDMSPQEKIEFILPIWYSHQQQIAAARGLGPPSMAADQL